MQYTPGTTSSMRKPIDMQISLVQDFSKVYLTEGGVHTGSIHDGGNLEGVRLAMQGTGLEEIYSHVCNCRVDEKLTMDES